MGLGLVLGDGEDAEDGAEAEQAQDPHAAEAADQRDAGDQVEPLAAEILAARRRIPAARRELGQEYHRQGTQQEGREPAPFVLHEPDSEVEEGEQGHHDFPPGVMGLHEQGQPSPGLHGRS